MSPPTVAGREKESNLARLLGSGRSIDATPLAESECSRSVGSAGIAELAVFHPVCDTSYSSDRDDTDESTNEGRYHCQTLDEQPNQGTWEMQIASAAPAPSNGLWIGLEHRRA